MSTMTRTDVHRPSAPEFDPEAYICLGVFDLDDEWDKRPRLDAVNAAISAGHAFASHQRPGQCGHCGAHLRYAALMLHEPTGQMIYVGETCLSDRFESLTAAEFQRLRESARLNRERATLAERIAEMTQWSPFLADLTYPQVTDTMTDFVADVAYRFRRDGRLTDAQIEAVDRAFLRHVERENERQAEARLPTVDVPEGAQVVTGTIVSVKSEPNRFAYGYVTKTVVRDERGFKVWGTLPSALSGARHGDRVTFRATLTRSDREGSFGFFKRPTKATFVERAPRDV